MWQVDLKEDLYQVGWIEQTNNGVILASGAKGLVALDNTSGDVIWKNEELKAIDKTSFLNIDGLPLFYVEYVPLTGKTRGVLVNSANGHVLFDTKDEDYRIKNFTVLPEEAVILFELLNDKERILMSFSLKTWEKEWLTSLGEISGGLLGKIFSASFIDHGPMFDQDNNLIVGIKEHIYALNIKTGEILWTHEADKDINALVYSHQNNNLYVGVRRSRKLLILDPSNGKDITPDKLKLRGTLVDIRPDNDNNLICVESEGFNIIDPATNEFKWKKSYKIQFLDEVIAHEKGFVAIGKNDKDGSISLVDFDGEKIWNSNVKGYSYYTAVIPKGVLYISTERSNILDFEKGKDVWDKDVKFKSIPAVTFDTDEDKVVLFENGNAYKFDLKTGSVDLFAEDIELEEVKKKTPLVAEYVEGSGYLINTDQHMSLLTPSGSLVYTSYFEPASSISGLVGIAQIGMDIAGVDIDIQGSMDNISMLSSLSNGVVLNSADQNDVAVEESMIAGLYMGSEDDMTTVFEVTKQRYSNSQHVKDHQFIVTKVKHDTAPTTHKIYMVNKKTGSVDAEIELMDKTPNYFIDSIDGVVFTNEKNYLITAYKF
ncbi:PQQ-binding-like beta-propeller repeat protein [Tamlana agarivorans]|uniref:PQQ-binding-like beta-propeller repeat protein n=1 Tax=Pseudotamlana agarivorans TaxID=481183 RepID=A0ACC5U521_9FLAO|nr:PQQ-binding-like beta-propeller repeat protein [Tamlana agarivorans]MBU2949419.1 PQQ-binding-like beta-propeller repeat protein [Tamlana agarivorans]